MNLVSFHKMIREKRIKIVMLVLVLFVANFAYRADSLAQDRHDITLIVKENGKEIACIAKGEDVYSALDWAYPIPNKSEDLPRTDLYYKPQINGEFNNNFETANAEWKHTDWTIVSSFEPIVDTRWENFRTHLVHNDTRNIIDNRIEIPNAFNMGISIRSNSGTKILLSEGWHPDKYPCYMVNLGVADNRRISLQKCGSSTNLYEFQSNKDIFLEHEWQTFTLIYTINGSLILVDTINNLTLINYTKEIGKALKPIYLFMSSASPSLWKIHTNRYLHTNMSSVSKFGPSINATSSTICITLHISMCLNCSIKFFVLKNNSKQILADINGSEMDSLQFYWKNVKLIIEDNKEDIVQVQVETESTASDKFWAVDDVRICTDNEIKIATLSMTQYVKAQDSQVSCHALRFQEWRPTKQYLPLSSDLPILQHQLTPTTIKLTWTPTGDDNLHYYIIKYEGSDLCTSNTTQTKQRYKNTERLKSNGWITTDTNEVTIEKLVPYTFYLVTFEDAIYLNDRTLSLYTEKTEKPTPGELPQNVRVRSTENSAKLFFDDVMCNVSYGPLVYKVVFSNKALNYSKSFADTRSNYRVENLVPFTNYNITIVTARNISNFNEDNLKFTSYYNFTTKPDLAQSVQNLEVYETDETSIAIRYDLPGNANGKPDLVRIQYCHRLYLNNCKFNSANISKCKLWHNKYCAQINDLVKNYKYLLTVSLKNENTRSFGEEVNITALTNEKDPGPPMNLTYKATCYKQKLEYCDLIVSWLHPYDQRGAITAFDVFLIESTEEVDKSIHEVLQVPSKSYQSEYVMPIKFVPYWASYNISVRAINNKNKGKFTSIEAHTDHIRSYLYQIPSVVNHTDAAVLINVPELDQELGVSSLTILIQNVSREQDIDPELLELANYNLCLDDVETWIAKCIEASDNHVQLIEIGDGNEMYCKSLNKTITNKPLKPNVEYCINFVFKNIYQHTEVIVVYHEKHVHTQNSIFSNIATATSITRSLSTGAVVVLIVFSILIVLTVGGLIVYKYGRNIACGRQRRQEGEHVYESMPFDNYSEPSVVYNVEYDKLNH